MCQLGVLRGYVDSDCEYDALEWVRIGMRFCTLRVEGEGKACGGGEGWGMWGNQCEDGG